MNETLLKKTIAENIAYYRKEAGLTQSELSEKINYSDKSVSKWERGDGVPDIIVLAEMAELFGITVNDLVGTERKKNTRVKRTKNRTFVTLLSSGIPWLVAAVIFCVLKILLPECTFAHHFFVYAIAVSGIVATVLTSIWFSHVYQLISVSMIIWGVAISVHLSIPGGASIYIIAVVMELLSILWYGWKMLVKKEQED
ncbi:MAG: helix-turn-helix transcriptional regulator [Clostridia bacterium]|nr:helix-turn-helix transcriptional regulator [Clostridia bacterium]